MSRWFGKIGFSVYSVEDDIYHKDIVEKDFSGIYYKQYLSYNDSNTINGTFHPNFVISIILDEYIVNNLDHIEYLTAFNKKFKVTGFDIQKPRIILTLGGFYNEENKVETVQNT